MGDFSLSPLPSPFLAFLAGGTREGLETLEEGAEGEKDYTSQRALAGVGFFPSKTITPPPLVSNPCQGEAGASNEAP